MKCCEGLEKMEGMKEKMAEKMKMKAAENLGAGPEKKSGEPKGLEKSPHQH